MYGASTNFQAAVIDHGRFFYLEKHDIIISILSAGGIGMAEYKVELIDPFSHLKEESASFMKNGKQAVKK